MQQSILIEFFEGIFLSYEFIGEIYMKSCEKIGSFCQHGSPVKDITRIITTFLLISWILYTNYVFVTDVYNTGYFYAIDNQFYINRYYCPLTLFLTYVFIFYKQLLKQ
jgi:hypothetical protein